MKNGIDELIGYIESYIDKEKSNDNDEHILNELYKLKKTIEERKHITDYNIFVELAKKYENSDIDKKLVDIMLSLDLYNVYIMNKKYKRVVPEYDKDMEPVINIDLTDILTYLETSESELDSNLINDLKHYCDKDKIMNMATLLKNGNGMERILFDKITDKNVLIAILLHSNMDIINNIIKIFKENDVNLNKFVPNMPFIFIDKLISEKCKFDIPCNYSNFIANYNLLKKFDIDFKKMSNCIVFFVNQPEKNEANIEELAKNGIHPSSMLYYLGNMLTINPGTVFGNIGVANYYNIEFTDDNNNNGYTILGMPNLDEKISYLIEQGQWKREDKKLDNLDLIRALIIKDDYLGWKNNKKCVILESDLFLNKSLSEEAIASLYSNYPILARLDETYLKDGDYFIDGNWISRYRLLKNLYNYKGTGNALIDSLYYNSSIEKEVLDRIAKLISSLEMGEYDVKLPQRI